MSIGLGIALAGVWLLPTAAYIGNTVSSNGVYLSIIVSSVMTFILLSY